MQTIKKFLVICVTLLMSVVVGVNSAFADRLSVTWSLLFPIPIPLPLWTVDHPNAGVTIGFLFPVFLPVPVYNYDNSGPVFHHRMERRNYGAIPEGSRVYIDGRDVGKAADYASKSPAASLPDGSHSFELKDGDKTLYAYNFEVSGGIVKDVSSYHASTSTETEEK